MNSKNEKKNNLKDSKTYRNSLFGTKSNLMNNNVGPPSFNNDSSNLIKNSEKIEVFNSKTKESLSNSIDKNRRMTISVRNNKFTLNNLANTKTNTQSNSSISKLFKGNNKDPDYLKEENKKLKLLNKYLSNQLNLVLQNTSIINKSFIQDNEVSKDTKRVDNKQFKLSKTIFNLSKSKLENSKSPNLEYKVNLPESSLLTLSNQINLPKTAINSPNIKKIKLLNENINKSIIQNKLNPTNNLNNLNDNSAFLYSTNNITNININNNKSSILKNKSYINSDNEYSKYVKVEEYNNLSSSSSSKYNPEIDLKGYNLLDKIYNKIDDQAYMDSLFTNNSQISKLLVDYIGEKRDKYQRRKSLLLTNKSNRINLSKK